MLYADEPWSIVPALWQTKIGTKKILLRLQIAQKVTWISGWQQLCSICLYKELNSSSLHLVWRSGDTVRRSFCEKRQSKMRHFGPTGCELYLCYCKKPAWWWCETFGSGTGTEISCRPCWEIRFPFSSTASGHHLCTHLTAKYVHLTNRTRAD